VSDDASTDGEPKMTAPSRSGSPTAVTGTIQILNPAFSGEILSELRRIGDALEGQAKGPDPERPAPQRLDEEALSSLQSYLWGAMTAFGMSTVDCDEASMIVRRWAESQP
jgi:hypothetical protein